MVDTVTDTRTADSAVSGIENRHHLYTKIIITFHVYSTPQETKDKLKLDSNVIT